MKISRLIYRLLLALTILGVFAVVLWPLLMFGQTETLPATPDDVGAVMTVLAPVLAGLLGKYGWVSQVLLIMGALRVCLKPVMFYLERKAAESPGTEDDEKLAKFEHGPIYHVISFILDFGGSVKLPAVTKLMNQGTMKILSILTMAALVALIGGTAGCATNSAGKRVVDVVKLSQAKAMIEPAAAGALRRVLQNSPEHAPLIARYAASVAGVFCTMSLSNQFSPDFLIAEADKFFDPALAKIGDGYVIDAKNAAIGIYRLLWGDRLRAEIPADQWLHQVCEFFCESINQGLTDAGFPGGVRKSASIADWGLRIADSGAAFKHAARDGMRVGDLSLNTPPAYNGAWAEWSPVAIRMVPFPSPLPSPEGEGEPTSRIWELSRR